MSRFIFDDEFDGAYVRLIVENDQGEMEVDCRIAQDVFDETMGELSDMAVRQLQAQLDQHRPGPRGPGVDLGR